MRHRLAGRKFGRKTSSRLALRKSLICALFTHERIRTTRAKAKEYRAKAEKLITMAKVDSVANRRRVFSILRDDDVVRKLFVEIGPRFRDRPGGYTRILHYPKGRVGDNAPMALFELLPDGRADEPEPVEEPEAKKKKKVKKTKKAEDAS